MNDGALFRAEELQAMRQMVQKLDALGACEFSLTDDVEVTTKKVTLHLKADPAPGFELMRTMASVYIKAPSMLSAVLRRILADPSNGGEAA